MSISPCSCIYLNRLHSFEQLEAEFQEALRQQRAAAEEAKRRAERYDEEGDAYVARAKAMLPQLAMSVGSLRYYFDRLELSRTQHKMEDEFGRDYFTSTLRPKNGGRGVGAGGSAAGDGGVLSSQECEALVAKLMLKNQEKDLDGGGGGGGGGGDDEDEDDGDLDSYGEYRL